MPMRGKASRDAVMVRALAFGQPDGSLWAAALDAGAPALIAGGEAEPVATAVSWDAADAGWRLRGDGVDLTVVPAPEPEPSPEESGGASGDGQPPSPPPWSGRQQLCRVTGTLAGADVDARGVCTELDQLRPDDVGSVRGVSGWVSAEEAVTLLALRPRGRSHHEDDLVAATVFDAHAWAHSIDPRLSTTYDGEGEPTRTTLELWIAAPDGEGELPRRAAGEATGPVVRLAGDGVTLEVRPLRCHLRGNDGAGVYLLASL